jgi:hypothetical protein
MIIRRPVSSNSFLSKERVWRRGEGKKVKARDGCSALIVRRWASRVKSALENGYTPSRAARVLPGF